MTAGTTLPSANASHDIFSNLVSVCEARGLDPLAGRLAELKAWLKDDLADVDRILAAVAADWDTPAHKSAQHLLQGCGKRLRPICVALASQIGHGFSPSAKLYAVAVELVHNATLLHDDVVDLGERRRGAQTARVIYGNAASIFGGDWLLIEALGKIQAAGAPDVLDRMLDVVREMVVAESMQLANRGTFRCSSAEYFRIVDGKTASLFRWAMFAGARAGGVSADMSDALVRFGHHLGLAFQLVDDVLDVTGDPDVTGKTLLSDLSEGKMTYPLLLALERDSSLGTILESACEGGEILIDADIGRRIAQRIEATGAAKESLNLAQGVCGKAIGSLSSMPDSHAKSVLESIAAATPKRKR